MKKKQLTFEEYLLVAQEDRRVHHLGETSDEDIRRLRLYHQDGTSAHDAVVILAEEDGYFDD
jgi:hypothetical protein